MKEGKGDVNTTVLYPSTTQTLDSPLVYPFNLLSSRNNKTTQINIEFCHPLMSQDAKIPTPAWLTGLPRDRKGSLVT